jgi:hypothetical protein
MKFPESNITTFSFVKLLQKVTILIRCSEIKIKYKLQRIHKLTSRHQNAILIEVLFLFSFLKIIILVELSL